MLTRAPRSAADLRSRLIAKEVEPDVADEVIARYREVGLLDDASLAAMIARTRHLERGQAPRAIAVELRRKGFDDECIRVALAPLTVDMQEDRARDLAAARWSRDADVDSDVKTRRTVAYLARKGYPASLAFALVRDLKRADSEAKGN